jgi:site-specific DNA-methyltransferase (adenine-specific)
MQTHIVTDPPYGVKEYDTDQLEKRTNGDGGIWRIPPSFDGHQRSPLPRFTALNQAERERVQHYFYEWTTLVVGILRAGGHMFLASNTFFSQTVFAAIVEAGFEFRGEVIRLVRTLRGEIGRKMQKPTFLVYAPCREGAMSHGASSANRFRKV